MDPSYSNMNGFYSKWLGTRYEKKLLTLCHLMLSSSSCRKRGIKLGYKFEVKASLPLFSQTYPVLQASSNMESNLRLQIQTEPWVDGVFSTPKKGHCFYFFAIIHYFFAINCSSISGTW